MHISHFHWYYLYENKIYTVRQTQIQQRQRFFHFGFDVAFGLGLVLRTAFGFSATPSLLLFELLQKRKNKIF